MIVNRRGKMALTQFRSILPTTLHAAAMTRARSRSSLARPYIWCFTSLSFVIWPSVCPFDHGSLRAAWTASRSVVMPLARDSSKPAFAAFQLIGITLADHGMELVDEIADGQKIRRCLLDRDDQTDIVGRQMIALRGHHLGDYPCRQQLARPT